MKSRPAHSPKLGPWLQRTLIFSGVLLWLTGVVWLWLHMFMQADGTFGRSPHPSEPTVLMLHGLLVTPMVLAAGGIVFGHIGNGWSWKRKRMSGLSVLTLFGVLSVTGFLLYYAGADVVRDGSKYVHWVVGSAAPVIVLWHALVRIRRKKRAAAASASSADA